MYKLYKVNYANSGTEEYYCQDIVVGTSETEVLSMFDNGDNENVTVEEFIVDGYSITVSKDGD